MQLAAWLFPAANSNVDYAAGAPNTSVSNNIFLSLNNARVPADSYTIFQTGRANVVHSSRPPQSAAETPVATYNGGLDGYVACTNSAYVAASAVYPDG